MPPHPLTPDVVADEEALGEAIDTVLQQDAEIVALADEVRRLQRELRLLADDAVWELYLRLDAATGDRASAIQELLVRWAFRERRRSVVRRQGGA